ncbi:hypothetical protein [Sphingomonas sp. S2-65]|uniref:hypothetical protein n=1 Tax=Sphingomonas sp. S2-65 TaxID=2903960 RepID=UPI001F275311|nr:hypothetical protein [Sphingomonas sp. S2-65]UYY58002.1 hypothetical protein LZ586_15260 [Sphingomonas sp. S2-65]
MSHRNPKHGLLQHGTVLLADTFLEVRRVDEGNNELPKVRLVEIPLYAPEPKRRPIVRNMDEALLSAAIDAGEVLVVATRRYVEGKPVLAFDADIEALMSRCFRPRQPTAKPTIEDLFRQGVLFRGSELAATTYASRPQRAGRRKPQKA